MKDKQSTNPKLSIDSVTKLTMQYSLEKDVPTIQVHIRKATEVQMPF